MQSECWALFFCLGAMLRSRPPSVGDGNSGIEWATAKPEVCEGVTPM